MPTAYTCPWCLQPVRGNHNGTLVFHVDGSEEELERWGKLPWLERSFHFSHNTCQPPDGSDECGYYVGLERIPLKAANPQSTDDYPGWLAHLERKLWWWNHMEEGLRLAAELRQRFLERARRPSTSRTISPGQRARILQRDNFRCRRCGHGAPKVPLVVDHIQPWSKGGRTADGNLQTLCLECNVGKSDAAPTAHDLAAAHD